MKDRTDAPPEAPSEPPAIGLAGWLRWAWRQLTSMRIALVLLLLLALGAVPGSLIPQTSVAPIAVADFLEQHSKLGPLYDKLGLFDVYKSAWFSAIYLLLFISLIGCVVPRVAVYWRAVRSRPPKPPRNLHRLGGYQRLELDQPGTEVLAVAQKELRRRRFRVQRYGDDALGAERGYLREAGNLVFHFSLIVTLIGVAWGSLFGYRGTVLVVVGNGFANSVAQYDDFTPGRVFDADDLPPFSLTVQDFDVEFQADGPQRGAAREFNAPLTYQETPDGPERSYDLRVNHPLVVDGVSVHLLGHGYAPRVTVKDGTGKVAFSGPAPFLPQDGNFSSFGVIKALDAKPVRLGFEGYFLPTGVIDQRGPVSVFPDDLNPVMAMTAYYGRPQPETGRPESVYQLDKTKLTQFESANGDKLRFQLAPGQSTTLPDKAGSITFDGYSRWVKLQVSHTPGLNLALAGILLAILGLMGSLFIHPRRTWVRVRSVDGRTVVEVAGLDRGPERGLGDELEAIAEVLRPHQEQPS